MSADDTHDDTDDLTPDDDLDLPIVGGGQPLVPPGRYRARMVTARHATILHGIPKIEIRLEIIEGDHAGVVLSAWRNLSPDKNTGEVGLGMNCKLAKEIRHVAIQRGRRKPAQTRLSTAALRGVDLAVQTATTGTAFPYSKVDEILGLWRERREVAPRPAEHPAFTPSTAIGGDGDGNGDADLKPKPQPVTGNRQRSTCNNQQETGEGTDTAQWVKEYDSATQYARATGGF